MVPALLLLLVVVALLPPALLLLSCSAGQRPALLLTNSEFKKLISAMPAASARRHRPLHSWLLLVLEGMKLFVVMVLPHPTCARTSLLLLLQKRRKLLERGRER